MKRLLIFISMIMLVAGLGAGVWAVTRKPAEPQIQASISAVQAVNGTGDTGKFARVTTVRPFVFPQDHGAHRDYRTEWWYYTGNLADASGRRFGFQLTFFRSALSDAPITRTSTWATNDIYMAHFALTDVQNNRFYAFDRFSRDAAGLAGADGDPYRIFLEDWSAAGSGSEGMTMRLIAKQNEVAIDLTLDSSKIPTLQGDRGLSQKGTAIGNASYYYSLTNMTTNGTLNLPNEQPISVTGKAWMDHEWGTSALEGDAVGWDWFALQLDDNREITYFNIRMQDGSIEPRSGGTITLADGSTRKITADQVQLDVLNQWTSPDGTAYPAKWRLQIPSEQLDLTITPQIANQELPLRIRYWEGTVKIEGSATGYGYVELTGYGDGEAARAN